MAQFDTQYYQGNDQYSDGDIEERILQIVRDKTPFEASGDRSFPVLYHLSPVRENILSWYGFRSGASVLEIGAGPGAVTGLLCRRCASVTSVELSYRRAKINYERHKEMENLTIMVGNLNDMHFDKPFDYVVLNGVFEYAGSFTKGKDPYGSFLSGCAGYLKEDGLLLIAIENRLGLKYFAGAPEDHTDNYMEGLKGYPDNPAVRTFSKKEWEGLLDGCGLSYRKFYYPYPDYKFPNEIYTGETLRADSFAKNAWNFNPRRLELFSEQEMGQTLCKEGVMECFMNSFLIEAGSEEAKASAPVPEILYAKISCDRAPQYRIQTVIRREADGTKTVVKSPLTREAEAHLRAMHEREAEAHDCRSRLLAGRPAGDGSLVYPFLSQKSLEERILPEASSIRDACSHLVGILREDRCEARFDEEGFTALFGTARPEEDRASRPVSGEGTGESAALSASGEDTGKGTLSFLVSPANIDLIFDNLFPSEEGDVIIDGEWITDTPVPASFLLWRAVNELYVSRKELERVLPQERLLLEYGIGPEQRQLFWKWASHFEKEYVQANRLALWATEPRKADLSDLRETGPEARMTATLYTDRGNGFREEDALHVDLILKKGRYDVTFEIAHPDKVRALRFDPLEGSACVCGLHVQEGKLVPVNASGRSRSGDVFLTMDPAYRVFCRKIPSRLHIAGTVRTRDMRWALDKSRELLGRTAGGLAQRILRRAARQLKMH